MPSWQPNWTDVRFDHAAAADAARELRAAAGRITDVLGARARSRASDLTSWVGPARDDWDTRFDHAQRQGHALVERLRREAGRIDLAAENARDEQRRREAARDRWWAEKRAEDEAARAAAKAAPPPAPSSCNVPRGVC